MKIIVCPLSRVAEMVGRHTPERVVSLLDPGLTTPDLGANYRDRHLRLSFHDVHIPSKELIMPSQEHIGELVSFLIKWQRKAPFILHCGAGIGRSTATAFIAACLYSPELDEREIALGLRSAAPFARPNETLVELADHAMCRNGRMGRAIVDTGRGLPWPESDGGKPFEMPYTYQEVDGRGDTGICTA